MSKAIGITFEGGELVHFAVVDGQTFPGHVGPDGLRKALADAGAIRRINLLRLLARDHLDRLAASGGKSAIIEQMTPRQSKPFSFVDSEGTRHPNRYEKLDDLFAQWLPDQTPPLSFR